MPRWWLISAARMRECRRFWLTCRRVAVAEMLTSVYGLPRDLAMALGIFMYPS